MLASEMIEKLKEYVANNGDMDVKFGLDDDSKFYIDGMHIGVDEEDQIFIELDY